MTIIVCDVQNGFIVGKGLGSDPGELEGKYRKAQSKDSRNPTLELGSSHMQFWSVALYRRHGHKTQAQVFLGSDSVTSVSEDLVASIFKMK
jgi:hypothetical protein